MKFILGTVAAVMLVGAAFAQPAEARCFMNGPVMQCWHPHPHFWRQHYWHHGWDRGWHRGW